MAAETVSARVTTVSATQDVYTCPAGKTARLVAASIRNSADPAADVETTIQWVDSSESPAVAYNYATAMRIFSGESVNPFYKDFTLAGGDIIRVRPLTGQLDVVLTFDVAAELLVTKGYELTTGDVNIGGDDVKGYRIAGMSVSASGDDVLDLTCQFVDSSASSVVLPILHNMPIIPGVVYHPLAGNFGLSAGDRLRARGSAAGATLIITLEPQTSLQSSGAALSGTTFTTVASAATGTARISFLSLCNRGTTDENVTAQFVDSSDSNAVIGLFSADIPPGVTGYPLGDLALNTSDLLQIKGTGTSQVTAVATVEA